MVRVTWRGYMSVRCKFCIVYVLLLLSLVAAVYGGGPERITSPVRAETPVPFLRRPGLHVVQTATERTSALAENSHVATLCVREVKCVCACECVDPPKEDGRLPGRHRSPSPACFTVGTVQSRARRGDLARLSPALARPVGSSVDGSPRRRRDSSRAPRLPSSAGPGQARGPGLWVCHAPEDGHYRPELVPRLRWHQHGSLELHFTATPADNLRRGERFLPPVLGQEWRVRWRGVPAERGAAAAATQRVSNLQAVSIAATDRLIMVTRWLAVAGLPQL